MSKPQVDQAVGGGGAAAHGFLGQRSSARCHALKKSASAPSPLGGDADESALTRASSASDVPRDSSSDGCAPAMRCCSARPRPTAHFFAAATTSWSAAAPPRDRRRVAAVGGAGAPGAAGDGAAVRRLVCTSRPISSDERIHATSERE